MSTTFPRYFTYNLSAETIMQLQQADDPAKQTGYRAFNGTWYGPWTRLSLVYMGESEEGGTIYPAQAIEHRLRPGQLQELAAFFSHMARIQLGVEA